MTNFLTKLVSSLPVYHRAAILSLVERKKKTGELTGQRQVSDEIAKLQAKLVGVDKNSILNPIYAIEDEKISSANHNTNMESVFLDMNSLFRSIEDVSTLKDLQAVSLNSEYLKSKATIEKLINDVRVFSLRKKFPDFNEVKVVDFNSSKNNTKSSPAASISSSIRLLELRTIYSSRAHLINRGERNTQVYTKTYASGIKGSLSQEFSPDKMVDQRPESFWGHLVLADVPISQRYDLSTSSGVSQMDVNGPITEVYFSFSHIEKINTIRLLPFGEYPIRVVAISYRGNNNNKIFHVIDNFTSTTTLDWEEYNFDPVFASEVRITTAQENYKNILYHLPKRLVTGTDIFQKIFENRTRNIVKEQISDSDYQLNLLSTVDSYSKALDSLRELTRLYPTNYIAGTEISFLEKYISSINSIYTDIDPDISDLVINQYFNTEAIQDEEDIVEINKYEYLLGIREVEISYEIYSPVAYYESEKFSLQATPSEVVIEVDDYNIPFKTQWESSYQKTSVEWDINLGDGRRLPIHPRNIVDDVEGIPAVKDERLFFDSSNFTAYSRLGSYYASPYRLKKNGQVVSPQNYTSVRQAAGVPTLKIIIDRDSFDLNSIYTIDYAVSSDSYSIDILNSFSSRTTLSPELVTEFGQDNDVVLSKFPYINYEVINLDVFEKEDDVSKWVFVPEQNNVFSGQVRIYPTVYDSVGNTLQTGNITGYNITGLWGTHSGEQPQDFSSNPNLASKYFNAISGIDFGYYLQIMDSNDYGKVESFGTKTFILTEPIETTYEQISTWASLQTGISFVGSLTGDFSGYLQVDYALGIGVESDGEIYTLGNTSYEPIFVKVGGKLAKNITNYETLIHPAFNAANKKDAEYEYIQAGRKLYFNQPVDGKEVSVEYRWIAEYLQVLGKLRCNKLVTPDLTPKVDEIRILINNMVI